MYVKYLTSVLRARRDKIVKYYFDQMSPLDRVRFKGDEICFDDLVVVGGYGRVDDAFYEASVDGGNWQTPSYVGPDAVCHEPPSKRDTELRIRVRRTYQQEFAKEATFRFKETNNELTLVEVER